MKKLELKHLAPYLLYGLKLQWIDLNEVVMSADTIQVAINQNIKPILRHLSDLPKHTDTNSDYVYFFGEINGIDGMGQAEAIARGIISIRELDYGTVGCLLEHHYDVFGLIDKGLAIDINTLTK